MISADDIFRCIFLGTLRVNNDSFGSFQDANGSMGFTKEGIQTKPVAIIENHVIVQIASGSDHLVCLTDKGEIITLGKFCICSISTHYAGYFLPIPRGQISAPFPIENSHLFFPIPYLIFPIKKSNFFKFF